MNASTTSVYPLCFRERMTVSPTPTPCRFQDALRTQDIIIITYDIHLLAFCWSPQWQIQRVFFASFILVSFPSVPPRVVISSCVLWCVVYYGGQQC